MLRMVKNFRLMKFFCSNVDAPPNEVWAVGMMRNACGGGWSIAICLMRKIFSHQNLELNCENVNYGSTLRSSELSKRNFWNVLLPFLIDTKWAFSYNLIKLNVSFYIQCSTMMMRLWLFEQHGMSSISRLFSFEKWPCYISKITKNISQSSKRERRQNSPKSKNLSIISKLDIFNSSNAAKWRCKADFRQNHPNPSKRSMATKNIAHLASQWSLFIIMRRLTIILDPISFLYSAT